MTLKELASRAAEVEKRYTEDPKLPGEPAFQVVVSGLRDGNRCRVFPGLMGDFVSHVQGGTLVLVKTRDVRKFLENCENFWKKSWRNK